VIPIQQTTFGYAIAFISPGVVVLWALSKFSQEVRGWFGIAANAEATVAGFLFVLLAAVALGVFASGVRWAIVDNVLELFPSTRQPDLDRTKLKDPDTLASYNQMTELYYRYYQFYSNMLVALIAAYVMWLCDLGLFPWQRPASLAGVAVVSVSLFASARDAWKRYYKHLREILGVKGERGR
jgi:hypothetical protein